MFGVIGEDQSDVDTLRVIIRRLWRGDPVKIRTRGYSGCGQMLNKGAGQFGLFRNQGASRFVVCHDADQSPAAAIRDAVLERVIRPARVSGSACIVVPIQEIEAWILADLSKVSVVIPSWAPPPNDIASPEAFTDPKDWLERLSRQHARPRYVHAVHNTKIAEHLDFAKVARSCPSFRPLQDFVQNGLHNC